MKQVKCEVYSRVVGFYRPVSEWNVGKKKEFKERKPFIVNKSKRYEVEHDEKV